MRVIKNEKSMVEMAGISLPLNKAIILNSYSAADTEYKTLYRNGSAYQVPVGKKLIIVAVSAQASSTTSTVAFIGYGDNAVSSTVAPTNNVQMNISGSGNGALLFSGVSTNRQESQTYLEIPASKYPYIKLGSAIATVMSVLAYLEDA